MLKGSSKSNMQICKNCPTWGTFQGRGRELEVEEVVRMMKSRCNLTELCKQYPLASSTLQRSWDICDAAVSTNQCA
jgi:hypothetical protein